MEEKKKDGKLARFKGWAVANFLGLNKVDLGIKWMNGTVRVH